VNVGSCFSGIGGLDHGLSRAGHDHVFLCESDPWRRRVLAERFPGAPIYDDVRDVAGSSNARADERGSRRERGRHGSRHAVDLLCGGFPCQDLSVAGQRRGLMHQGGRSNLFFEFARISESLRPRWLLIENVPGLLSSNGGRDFGELLGTLADIGYGVAWRVLDSRFFGVPQRRRRVFIVGAVVDGDPRAAAERAGQVLAVGTRCDRHFAAGGEAGAVAPVASLSGLGNGGPDDNDGQAGRLVAETVRSHPRPGSNSNGNLVAAFSENQRAELVETPIARQLTTGGGKPGQGYSAVREGASVRRLTPVECERLQGLPDDWTNPHGNAPDSRRYAALGDAVTSPVGEWIGHRFDLVDRQVPA
jgi:DNA (cytosine-5)-methyltransferase 1